MHLHVTKDAVGPNDAEAAVDRLVRGQGDCFRLLHTLPVVRVHPARPAGIGRGKLLAAHAIERVHVVFPQLDIVLYIVFPEAETRRACGHLDAAQAA